MIVVNVKALCNFNYLNAIYYSFKLSNCRNFAPCNNKK